MDGQGFHPDRIPAHAGEPLTLVVTRTTDETCGTEILVPALGVDRMLPLNEKVEITQPQCMHHGAESCTFHVKVVG